MLHNKFIKYFSIILISLLLGACANSKTSLTEVKEAKLYMDMGMRYLEMGMLRLAKENLELAESIDSGNANIHNSLGALYERLKLLPKAEQQYQKAVALDVDNAGAKNNYGRFLCEREAYNEGMELLRDALALPLNNRQWFAYTNIGRCELLRGNNKLAEANLRKALQINPSFPPALFEMQKISYHAGKYMSARAFLERYLSIARHSSKTLWYAVQTERALGNGALVKKYRETLYNSFPASKEAQNLN